MRSWLIVCAYLFAIVVANLAVTRFGQSALPFTAFALIPFDLFSRDVLHERWTGRGLVFRMGALVLSGSVLSYLLNRSALNIALASCVAFATAGTTDSVVYQLAHRSSRTFKMNLSNAFSSVVDSVVFPLIAFHAFNATLSFDQAVAKFVGGAMWTHLYSKMRED